MSVLFLFYAFFILLSLYAWLRLAPSRDQNQVEFSRFSILIPLRNEIENLPSLFQSLEDLDYPNFEVIVINDDSGDGSAAFLNNYKGILDLKTLTVNHGSFASPKKASIEAGLKIANGIFIFCTDADCIVPPLILRKYAAQLHKYTFVSGPVAFKNNHSAWISIQQVEFSSLIGIGASSIFFKSPTMCSGANIAYHKSVFYEVNGYEGNSHLASGDDEFLMQKIALKHPITYAKDRDCIVWTNAQKDLPSFINQRLRWASKWSSYKGLMPSILAIFIFALNACTIFLELSGQWSWLVLRYSMEFLLLSFILSFLGKKRDIIYIPLVQLLYKYYVCIIGVRALFGGNYKWKNRMLR